MLYLHIENLYIIKIKENHKLQNIRDQIQQKVLKMVKQILY